MSERTRALRAALAEAERYLDGVDERPVGAVADVAAVAAALGGPLPARGEDPEAVVTALAAGADPGIVASAGPRYFGFVLGGTLPAALAADWLVSAWDQNAVFQVASPAAAAIEEVAAGWCLDLLGLPAGASVGFVTGAQGANTTCLAAARHAVLARAGWDVERDGLLGAPPVRVVCGEQAHVTISTALRLLGLGAGTAVRVAADDQGRMVPEALAEALAGLDGPDDRLRAGRATSPPGPSTPSARSPTRAPQHGAWLHVDGAFGLWAAAAPSTRALVRGRGAGRLVGRRRAQVAQCALRRRPGDRRRPRRPTSAAMSLDAADTCAADQARREPTNFVPESSRRARAVPVYAALRSLGRDGVAELVERNCAQARRMAGRLAEIPGAEVLNDVVLNQVLVRLPGGDDANRAASPRSSATGRAGSAGTRGTGATCCGCRSRTGRRPTRTSTARRRRSPPPPWSRASGGRRRWPPAGVTPRPAR